MPRQILLAVNKLKAKPWTDKTFGGDDLHCAAHILNLVVQDGMDIIKVADIGHVNSYGPRLQTFNLLSEMSGHKHKKGLKLDFPTRWNSTYTMLEEALEFNAALTSYADVQNIQGPTVEQWSLAERVCNILKKNSQKLGYKNTCPTTANTMNGKKQYTLLVVMRSRSAMCSYSDLYLMVFH